MEFNLNATFSSFVNGLFHNSYSYFYVIFGMKHDRFIVLCLITKFFSHNEYAYYFSHNYAPDFQTFQALRKKKEEEENTKLAEGNCLQEDKL